MTLTALFMRGVGVLYNRYLTARLGAAGLGLFSLVSSVYGFAVTVAVSGLPLAVTRVAAEEAGRGRKEGVHAALRKGIRYALFCGGISCVLLLLFSAPIGNFCLHDTRTVPSLRILALSLPFLSLSSVLGGYFMGTQRGALGSAIGAVGMLLRIAGTVFLLRLFSGKGMTYACAALALGAVLSEIAAFFISAVFSRFGMHGEKELCRTADTHVPGEKGAEKAAVSIGHALRRIAVPIALTAYIRSGLLTVEHLLIPVGLEKYGSGAGEALASYGTLHGMVLPVLLFPAAFLAAVSGLLVPEIASFRAAGDGYAMKRNAKRVLRGTLVFAAFCAAAMRCFSGEIGSVLYRSTEAGQFLFLTAPLVVIMYLDTMTDALLKGLDEQVASMWINIFDAGLSAFLVWLLLPRFGVMGYVFILYASELINFALSASRLLRVMPLRFSLVRQFFLPLLCAVGGCTCSELFFSLSGMRFRFGAVDLTVRLLIALIFYGAFLMLCGSVRRKELLSLYRRLRREKHTEKAEGDPVRCAGKKQEGACAFCGRRAG